MMKSRIASPACAAVVGGLALAGCGTPKRTPSAPVKATGAACTPAKLHTHASRVLTVATDSPAYPPYFEHNNPKSGEGFESAVAYAAAKKPPGRQFGPRVAGGSAPERK